MNWLQWFMSSHLTLISITYYYRYYINNSVIERFVDLSLVVFLLLFLAYDCHLRHSAIVFVLYHVNLFDITSFCWVVVNTPLVVYEIEPLEIMIYYLYKYFSLIFKDIKL